jgi:hypothetical protein
MELDSVEEDMSLTEARFTGRDSMKLDREEEDMIAVFIRSCGIYSNLQRLFRFVRSRDASNSPFQSVLVYTGSRCRYRVPGTSTFLSGSLELCTEILSL